MIAINLFSSNNSLLLKIFLLFCTLTSNVKSYKVGNDPFRRAAYLDPQEKFHLEWMVNQTTSQISFSVTVQTRGWIIFGFANDAGERTGQDVIVGGVRQNGQPYFSDSHTGRFNERVQTDITPDYSLDNYWEKRGYTYLSFSREIDTCDHQDYRITENKITLIWAYGNDDDINGNFRRNSISQGTYDIYLLDPEYTPSPQDIRSDTSIQTWSILSNLRIPSTDTSYVCTIRKAPRLPGKHHIIGFNVKFDNQRSLRSTHHLVLHRCRAPKGISPNFLFEPFARSEEYQTCYSLYSPSTSEIPVHFCTQVYYLWALGGREFFLPDQVGIPFGEDSSEDEYYMLQAHYDNPKQRSNIAVGLQLDIFYTRELRQNDGGVMIVGHDVPGLPESLLIPPNTKDSRIFGHCSRECTERILPKEGITIVAGILHSHASGRRLRLHHFRGNKELPWVLYDDNYDKRFQQIRGLPREEVAVLPGDHLVMDCTYDNNWANGTVVGGYRTRQEMCTAYIFFYGPIPEYSYCRSGINSPDLRERFLGVRNITWRQSRLDWVAVRPSPRRLVGRTITDISDNVVEWNEQMKDDLENVHEKFPHVGSCGRDVVFRDPENIENWLRDNAQTRELRIKAEVPMSINTKDDYSGHVEYPYGAVPYFISETSCVHRGFI